MKKMLFLGMLLWILYAIPLPALTGMTSDGGYLLTCGSAGDDYINDMAASYSGDTFVCGFFAGGRFDAGSLSITGPVNISSGYVLKTDSTGDVKWLKNIYRTNSTTSVDHICCDLYGDVYVAGTYNWSAVFDQITLTNTTGFRNFIAKINGQTGEFIWAQTAPVSVLYNDISFNVIPNQLVACGSIKGWTVINNQSIPADDYERGIIVTMNPMNGSLVNYRATISNNRYASSGMNTLVDYDGIQIYAAGWFYGFNKFLNDNGIHYNRNKDSYISYVNPTDLSFDYGANIASLNLSDVFVKSDNESVNKMFWRDGKFNNIMTWGNVDGKAMINNTIIESDYRFTSGVDYVTIFKNMALNQKTDASSSCKGAESENAVDGKPETFWIPDNNPNSGTDPFIIINLGLSGQSFDALTIYGKNLDSCKFEYKELNQWAAFDQLITGNSEILGTGFNRIFTREVKLSFPSAESIPAISEIVLYDSQELISKSLGTTLPGCDFDNYSQNWYLSGFGHQAPKEIPRFATDDITVSKMRLDGSLEWISTGAGIAPSSMEIRYPYLLGAGHFSNSFTLKGITKNSNGGMDIYIRKMSISKKSGVFTVDPKEDFSYPALVDDSLQNPAHKSMEIKNDPVILNNFENFFKPARGVVADGVTPLFLTWYSPNGNYSPEFSYNSSELLNSHLKIWNGGSFVDCTSQSVFTVDNSSQWFACITGIEAYEVSAQLRAEPSCILSAKLKIRNNETGEYVCELPFEIALPPVALVHGYNVSNPNWGTNFINELKRSRSENFIESIGYGNTPFPDGSIPENTYKGFYPSAGDLNSALEAFKNKYLDQGWAITRFDVVAHSQGGVLTRILCQDFKDGVHNALSKELWGYQRKQEFNRGRFYRVITIGTPHYGSKIAFYNLQICDQSFGDATVKGLAMQAAQNLGDFLQEKFNPWGTQISLLKNLTVDSDARFHLIGCRSDQNHTPNGYSLMSLNDTLKSLIFGNDPVLGGSDGVVEATSQIAGMTGNRFTAPDSRYDISHSEPVSILGGTNGTENSSLFTASKTAEILDHGIPGVSGNRSDFFGPFTLLSDSEYNKYYSQEIRDRIISNLPQSDPYHPVNITAYGIEYYCDTESDDVEWSSFKNYNDYSNEGIQLVVNPDDSRRVAVTVDPQVKESVYIQARYAENGQWFMSKPFLVKEQTFGNLIGIKTEAAPGLMNIGEQALLNIIGLYDDNGAIIEHQIFFTDPKDITVTVSNPASHLIENSLIVKGIGPGTGTITIIYKGFLCSFNSIVSGNPNILLTAPGSGIEQQRYTPLFLNLEIQSDTQIGKILVYDHNELLEEIITEFFTSGIYSYEIKNNKLGERAYSAYVIDKNGFWDSSNIVRINILENNSAFVLTAPPDITVEAVSYYTEVFPGQPYTNMYRPAITNDSMGSFPVGTSVVTWQAVDFFGNILTAIQNITVTDSVAPVLHIPEDVVMGSNQEKTYVYIGYAYADDVSWAVVTNDAPIDEMYPIGETLINWNAVDQSGNTTTAIQKIIIIAAPVITMQPVIEFIGNKTIYTGEQCAFSIYAYDPDGDELTYSASNLPEGAVFEAETRQFYWTPSSIQAGNYPLIHFEVTDGYLSKGEDISITVITANSAPILQSIGGKNINEGETLEFTISAIDPDGDPIHYQAYNLPYNAFFDSETGLFSWTLDYQQAGIYDFILFEATDNNLTTSEEISITVNDVNRPPILEAISPRTINRGELLQFTLSADDPDQDILYYSTDNMPAGATLDRLSGLFTFTPDNSQSGSYNFQFIVTDGSLTDQKNMTITVISQEITVTVKLLNSNGIGLAGGEITYAGSSWKSIGTTGTDGQTTKELLPGTYTFRLNYGGASRDITQDIRINPLVTFQTTNTIVKFTESNGNAIAGAVITYAGSSWQSFGTTDVNGEAHKELLPANYTFRLTYTGASNDLTQNTGTNPIAVFTTKNTMVKFIDSNGNAIAGAAITYAGSSWQSFGTTDVNGEARKELLPANYTFRLTYAGASNDLAQNTGTNPIAVFTTKNTTVKFIDSNSNAIAGAAITYAGSSWQSFGTTDVNGEAHKELLPANYTFRLTYAGASNDITQNTGTNPIAIFTTKNTLVKFIDSNGNAIAGAAITYAGSSWQSFGTTDVNGEARKELLPANYTFRLTYAGASNDIAQNTKTNPIAVFTTKNTMVKFIDSNGNAIAGAAIIYAGSSWQSFGTTDVNGEARKELLPANYTFRLTYAGASNDLTQNTKTNPIAIFTTKNTMVKFIDSNGNAISGAAITYAGSSWQSFGTTDVNGEARKELLPANYTFRLTYAGASNDLTQNTKTNPIAVFTTKNTMVKFIDSNGNAIAGATITYAGSSWQSFGTTDVNGEAHKELLPANYTFRLTYAGASNDITQNTGTNPIAVFTTKNTMVKFIDSNGNAIAGATITYAGSSWQSFGTTDVNGEARKELLPANYTFRLTYAGASNDITQNTGTNPIAVFTTKNTMVKFIDSNGNAIAGAAITYAGSSWQNFGTTDVNGEALKELLPANYTFRLTYAGASNDLTQNTKTNPIAVFTTKNTTVKFIDSNGNAIAGATITYAGSSWQSFGTTDVNGEARKELLPANYTFRSILNGIVISKIQNTGINNEVYLQY